MSLPNPTPGLVIRYSYLWRDERLRKLEEGAKDRPCLIVLSVRYESGATVVTVAPITSRFPSNDPHAVELSRNTKRRLGLDDAGPSWVVTHDLNEFSWPGPDIRPTGSGAPRRFAHGLVSSAVYYEVKNAVLKHIRTGTLSVGRRSR